MLFYAGADSTSFTVMTQFQLLHCVFDDRLLFFCFSLLFCNDAVVDVVFILYRLFFTQFVVPFLETAK